MRYAISRFKYEQQEMAYRIYMSDSLFYYTQNQRLTHRYADFITNKIKIDNRSSDEIVMDVMNNAGLRFKE